MSEVKKVKNNQLNVQIIIDFFVVNHTLINIKNSEDTFIGDEKLF